MTGAQERTSEPRTRLIELAAFDRETRTSFVRTLEATFAEAEKRGWARDLVLPRSGMAAKWANALRDSGVTVHVAPEDDFERWLDELLGPDGTPTLLHSHFTTYDMATARAAARRGSARAIWHFHSVLGRSPRNVARNVAKLALGRRLGVAAMICPSETSRDALLRRGAPSSRMHVFHSAVDLEAFPVWDSRTRERNRESLGYRKGAVVLLHFGWDWKIKGGDRFLEAVARLRDGGVDAVGLTRADPEREREIESAGMKGVVHVQPPSEPWELFGVAHALMATSRGEGLPYTVLEALASGTPVVATDIGGHRPVAEAPLCTVVPPSPAALADAVKDHLARGGEELARDAAESREWVARGFSLDAYAERMVSFYADLFGAP